MNFDDLIERRGTNCQKWDTMEQSCGVSPDDGIAMWVADMDFRPPRCVQETLEQMIAHGVYGYHGHDAAHREAIRWWMRERHGWEVATDTIFSTNGIVNGVGVCIDTFTAPGEGVVLFTPVYHAFARVIRAAGRAVVECPLVNDAGRYVMDFDAYDAQMTGRERLAILCSPHNPGGRVWTRAELEAVAAFARRHDLILISDEIHHDLTFDGHRHIPMATLPGIADRLVMMTATTKTFNIAGAHVGNVIIDDPDLRARFATRMRALSISPGSFGVAMATAAYTPAGAAWVDDLRAYIDGNRRIFDAGIAAIPGVASMPLEATYLAWVDFNGTGMDAAEVIRRVQRDARIATNLGPSFGTGGEGFLRFNFATPRVRVAEAVERLQAAFKDLQ